MRTHTHTHSLSLSLLSHVASLGLGGAKPPLKSAKPPLKFLEKINEKSFKIGKFIRFKIFQAL